FCSAVDTIMSTFRLMQFSKSCLWALGRRDLACACVIARAMLENSAAFVDAARTVHATISKSTPFPDLNSDFDNTFVTSTALEEYCLKVVFASRLPESDDIYSSTNVLTILKRISKNSQADFLYRTYELLSEVSHPNWAARSFHISDSKAGDWKGNELRTITHAADAGWPVILEPTVAALSWSSAAQISAFQLMSEAIALVLARFPESR
ncbi:hypothetical protein, partial [Novosphingobium sp. PY1]|uniref:hypothetical protein n=1 Tax=Novosphingobium sp. PY1 TaxID=1882221 RepID=UPI001A903867